MFLLIIVIRWKIIDRNDKLKADIFKLSFAGPRNFQKGLYITHH